MVGIVLDAEHAYKYLFLIPLFPGLGALVNGLFLNRLPRPLVTFIAVGSIGFSFAVALVLFGILKATHEPITSVLYNWIASDTLKVNAAFLMDGLSGVMALVVTGVGWLIHVYSIGYMGHDKSYPRYFTYLNLFAFAMLLLVLGDSLPLMFVGWEGVGLCSYLLIGFWFTDDAKASAGKKAFIVNRIGDMGFVIAMLLLFWQLGALDFAGLAERAGQLAPPLTTAICLLLFLGATGKSAQLPLYVWLPDAMAGPTPVSALIHAATMVTAGVYMIARLNFLFVFAPTAMMVVAIVGALTAIFAATIGFFQYDIKKVLAYSTVSQLGFMFLGVGVGAFAAAIFHLMTHAFFKACLFLGSGSVIHGMHGEQDIRKMGGLAKFMPITSRTFLVSCIAIAGFPPLAAFFSKDEILYYAFAQHYGSPAWLGALLWATAALAAGGTAFYMFRLYYMTFSGECRAPEEIKKKGVHESPATMTAPLVVLAVLAIVGGWVGMPHIFHVPNLFHDNLHEVLASAEVVKESYHGSAGLEWALMGVSTAIALAGWLIARALYKDGRSPQPEKLKARFAGVHNVIHNKYYVDEGYYYAFIRPVVELGNFLWGFVDTYLVDGVLVRVSAWVVRSSGMGVRLLQTGNVQTYLMVFLAGTAAVLIYLWQGSAM
ncbi:MAG: NADH-quinone oxidoreductase subunit L [Myxococcales bacterium]|nr:MAG: NADH-quinone oxidoreductase subunit L [Myxococcales bacterium]